jgi:molybdenum cofactor biosynthesis protein B
MSAYEEHQRAAGQIVARCAVLTLSDTRDASTVTSGARIRELLTSDAHDVTHYEVLRDEPELLSAKLAVLLARDDVDVILTNGGTGISRRDATVPVIERVIESPLPGFGELFRMLSWEQIGSGAMLSRAIGGTASGKVVFAMPGSTKAVDLAMTRLILPEIRHILRELRK